MCIWTRLDEQKVEELHTAATIADDYSLTQKMYLQKLGFPTKSYLGNRNQSGQGSKPFFEGPPENSRAESDSFKPDGFPMEEDVINVPVCYFKKDGA